MPAILLKRDRLLYGLLEVDRARSDYHMAKRTGAQRRQRRGVPSQGAGADYHYRSESDWLWMSELAWELYRNNMALGSITDRAIENQLQGGFTYDPQTGDPKLDVDMKQWWTDISEDARECDPDAELCFAEQEEIVFRSTLVAGDIFGLPMEDGTVDLVESHCCRSPSRKTKENIVHGVEYVPGTRRRAAYWFLKEPVDPYQQGSIKKSDLTPRLAWEDDGERNVFHVRFCKRAKQTEGGEVGDCIAFGARAGGISAGKKSKHSRLHWMKLRLVWKRVELSPKYPHQSHKKDRMLSTSNRGK